ncbi:hypothetical protein ACGF7W_11415 [Streptomyces sp. NPDC048219]|uniref:hypothetical protein n=1 Tax=Streptomyces sp. NPDC048219 TaxID=3365517 RepID=UPI0037104AA1
MRPAPHPTATDRAGRAGRRGTWVRALVLLLALLVPCAHAQAAAAPPPVVAAESGGTGGPGGTATEYDHLDTAPRAPARIARRPAPPGWTPLSATDGHARTDGHPAPPAPPHAPSGTRSVVLRC